MRVGVRDQPIHNGRILLLPHAREQGLGGLVGHPADLRGIVTPEEGLEHPAGEQRRLVEAIRHSPILPLSGTACDPR